MRGSAAMAVARAWDRIKMLVVILGALAAGPSDVAALNHRRGSAVVGKSCAGGAASAVPRVVAFLDAKALRLNSVELTVLARKVGKHPGSLDKVKHLIRDMISQKQSELHASVTKNDYCNSELPKAKHELKKIQLEIDDTGAHRDRLAAHIAEVKEENDDLLEESAKMQKKLTGTQAVRDQERAEYLKAKAKYEAFQPTGSDDKMHAQIKIEVQEDWAQEAHVPSRGHGGNCSLRARCAKPQNGWASTRMQRTQVQLNEAAAVKMRNELAEADKDARLQADLLASAKAYENRLAKQCVVRSESYKERARRRNEEIESMKDAYAILGGDSYG
mmetsp:Transcript_7268/g.20612  ORF Transcript_7268/g.20612 Transcript_7268/m.20612 type:complete len:331 (-) Transcript_7268:87-1079(-)